jgi:hypothetical protein
MNYNLYDMLAASAEQHRINTVERGLEGAGLGQKNFKAKWEGYENGKAVVSYKGKKYYPENYAYSSQRKGGEVSLRVGKNTLNTNWR